MSHRFHQRKKKGFLDCVSRHCAQLEQIVRKADASGATGKWFFKKQSSENREPVPFEWCVRPTNSNSERSSTQFPSKFNNGTRKRFNWGYPVLIGETSICQRASTSSQFIRSIPTDWFYRTIKQRLCYNSKLISTTCAVSTVSKS
jgi:hypothetical protein